MKKSVMKKVVFEEPKKLQSWMKLIVFLYLFIFSIELIKKTSLLLAPILNDFLFDGLNPFKAICVGWFTTSITQSSGAIGSVVAAFTGNLLIDLPTAVYILIGASLGSTIMTLIISLIIVSVKRRDFRHGFEIGLCYAIYSALLIPIVVFLEYFFGFFSKTSLFLAGFLQKGISIINVPDFVGIITNPLIDKFILFENKIILLIFALIILLFTLKYIGGSIIGVLGGEYKTRRFMNKYFESKYKSYFLGVFLTAVVFSSGITVGLLVPLAVSRVVNLKKSIPFILGADLGTITDVFLASVILNQVSALAAAIAYGLFAVVGALIFLPNTEFLFKVTKYTSKKLMGISRKKALYVLIILILIPLGVLMFF